MHANPDSANEKIKLGPAYSLAARPVKTNIPAPITAPIPNPVNENGPNTRLKWLRLDSSSISLRDFFTNSFFIILNNRLTGYKIQKTGKNGQ